MSRRRTGAGRGHLGTPATVALERAQVPYSVHTWDHIHEAAQGSGYGREAAEALDLDPATVFKTLVVRVDGGRLVVAVVPVSGRLDLKALAAVVGGRRATLTDPAAAERSTGYVVGGISPLGQRRRLETVVDSSARDLATIFVSAGRRGADLGVDPGDLVRLLDARVAPISRP